MRSLSVFDRFDMRAALAAVLCAGALVAAAGTAGVPGGGAESARPARGAVEGLPVATLVVPGEEGSSVRLHGGVPFARSAAIRETDRLVLARRVAGPDGALDWELVDAQWSAAARWGGRRHDDARPLRWAHVAAVARGGERLSVLRAQLQREDDARALAVVHEDGVDVDTGALAFTVRRDRFAPFDMFTSRRGADGRLAPGPLTGSSDVVIDYAVLSGDDGVVERTTRLSRHAPTSVALESAGTTRATVVVRGAIELDGVRPPHALRYALRLHTWRAASDIGFTLSLTNTAPETPVYLRCVRLDVPTSLGPALRVTTADGGFDVASSARLVQRHDLVSRDDESENFRYTLDVDGHTAARGARSDGSFGVASGAQALRASTHRFWERWPGAIGVSGGLLSYEFLPAEPGLRWPPDAGDLPTPLGDAHRLDAGRQTTWRGALELLSTGAPAAAPIRRPIVDPQHVADTGAAGVLAPAEVDLADSALRTLARRHARLQRALVDVTQAEAQGPGGVLPPTSISTQREARGNADPSVRHDSDLYGWMDYGDLVDARGYVAADHDWLRGLLLGFLRHAEPLFLDEAEVALGHRIDVDQRHVTEVDGRPGPALLRRDRGRHGRWQARVDAHSADEPPARRTRLRGLLLAHALTAEPQALETATANALALIEYADRTLADDRSQVDIATDAIAIQELLAYSDHTGDARARAAALRLFEGRLLVAEERGGGEGEEQGRRRTPWSARELVAALDACVAVHEQACDPRALSFLLRLVRALQREGLAGSGRTVGGRYVPLQLPAFIGLAGAGRSSSAPLAALAGDAVTYAWQQTADPELRSLALRIFRDGVAFRDVPSGVAVAPGVHSVPSLVPRAHAGYEVSTGAWTLLSHGRLLSVLRRGGNEPLRTDWRESEPFFAESLDAIDEADRAYVADVLGVGASPSDAPLRLALVAVEMRGADLVLRTHASAPSRLSARLQRTDGGGIALAGRIGPVDRGLAQRHEVVFRDVPTGKNWELRIVARDASDRVQVLGPVALHPTRTEATLPDPAPSDAAPRDTGPAADPTRGVNPDPIPLPAPQRPRPPPLREETVDDQGALRSGEWRRVAASGAVGGAQSVAVDPDAPAALEFVRHATADGAYRLFMRWERVPRAATDARVEIEDVGGTTWLFVDQSVEHARWFCLGTAHARAGREIVVRVMNAGARGAVAVDALRFEEVERP